MRNDNMFLVIIGIIVIVFWIWDCSMHDHPRYRSSGKRDNDRIHLLQADVRNIWLNMELLIEQQIAICKDDPMTLEKLNNIKAAINEYIVLKKDGNDW